MGRRANAMKPFRLGVIRRTAATQQRPHPPILIGGNATRVLALAAKEDDIVGLTGIASRRGGAAPDVATFRSAAVDAQVALR